MTKKILTILYILTLGLQAQAAETQVMRLYNGKTKKYDDLKVVKIKNVWVTESCAKKTNCEALMALTKKAPQAVSTNGLAGNPGSAYCMQKGGVARILKDTKNSEYDYCLFKDGSMVDSWNMYSAHYPPTYKK